MQNFIYSAQLHFKIFEQVLDVETVFGFKHVIKVNTYLYSDWHQVAHNQRICICNEFEKERKLWMNEYIVDFWMQLPYHMRISIRWKNKKENENFMRTHSTKIWRKWMKMWMIIAISLSIKCYIRNDYEHVNVRLSSMDQ